MSGLITSDYNVANVYSASANSAILRNKLYSISEQIQYVSANVWLPDLPVVVHSIGFAEFLLIGGGGSGGFGTFGNHNGGGGGGGGFHFGSVELANNTVYVVTVGAGGTSSGPSGVSLNGGNTLFYSNVQVLITGGSRAGNILSNLVISYGGGAGGHPRTPSGNPFPPSQNGIEGGSAGGGYGSGPTGPGSLKTGASAIIIPNSPNEANISGTYVTGGRGGDGYGPGWSGAGGGAGQNGTSQSAGPAPGAAPAVIASGGAGKSSAITGTPVFYAGGGGGYAPTAQNGTVGGSPNGGGGNFGGSPFPGSNGTVNSGGGGGGGFSPGSYNGGTGGSGYAVLRMPNTIIAANITGGTITYTPAVPGSPPAGNVVYIFSTSGTIRW